MQHFFWALAVMGICTRGGMARGSEFFRPLDPPRPCQAVAWGGQAQVAPAGTRPALEAAIADLLEWAALDVCRTADGVHVIWSDAQCHRLAAGPPRVGAISWEALRALDAGSWFAARFAGTPVQSLDESLALAKGKINLLLQCHDVDAERLVEQIRAAGMERQVLLVAAGDSASALASAAGTLVHVARPWSEDAALPREAVVSLEPAEATAARCRQIHEAGSKVLVQLTGAEDQGETWTRLIDQGADLVVTARPAEFVVAELRRRLPPQHVEFCLHRCASRYAPENTLPSLAMAQALGPSWVEVDIRTSHDGGYVLVHDGTIDRTTNGKGRVTDVESAALSQLDAGSWFSSAFAGLRLATFDEFLAAASPPLGLYLDAKAIAPEALVAALRKHQAVDRAVVYQGPGYLAKLKALEPGIKLMPPLFRADQAEPMARKLRPYAFDTAWEILSPELIARCHELGVRVFSDALGDHEQVDDYRQAMRWGIDLIQTDHPLRVWRAIELEALARPAATPPAGE